MINQMQIGQNNQIYTFGDDCVLNIMSIGKENELNLLKTKSYSKRVNVIWTIRNHTMVNFYE
jgi:hypothetical protein